VMLSVCPETDMENPSCVSFPVRWRPSPIARPKGKGRAVTPGLLPFKTPVSALILPSAASKKQHKKATEG
jgi:hypothetical protein